MSGSNTDPNGGYPDFPGLDPVTVTATADPSSNN